MTATAQTSYGTLHGTEENGVCVFRGVPFAKPPVGALRFRPPQHAEGWSGVRDATRFGPGSIQSNRPMAPVLGIILPEQSEDCLYLNVWTPGVDDHRRPVLVWIHGGAWVIGAGSEITYDGSSLARRGDVVVVTLNYRLGIFGFLRSDALGTSGNEAMLDQVAALEWVRDEIAAFGGDPNDVTVMGESAGSVNVSCLLTMPAAKGLFHKAVMESGSPSLLKTPQAADDVTGLILKELDLAPVEAAGLRDLPAEQLMDAQNEATRRSASVNFAPVADDDLIPVRPFDAIAEGSARGIPALIGTNREEMKLYRFLDPAIETLDEAGLWRRAEAVFPGADSSGRSNGERAVAVYRDARAARGEETTPAEIWFAIATDQVFRAGAMRLAELQSANAPTYVYRFDWKATVPGGPQGAVHALELPFVFGTLESSKIGDYAGRGADAQALSERMQDAWLAFVRTGSPCSKSLPEWEPYAAPRRATMLLGEQPRLVEAPQEPERAFWDEFLR